MNKSLLIVDDDVLVAKVYSTKFTQVGFNVLVAPNGALALKLLKESLPDAVLLDLQLPDMPGADVLKKIRAMEGCTSLPVIVFSSTYLSSAIQEAWKAGATKCLSKANCPPTQLVSIVHAVLQPKEPAPSSPGQATAVFAPETAPATVAAPPTPKQEPEADNDPALTASLRQDFAASLPTLMGSLRAHLQALNRALDLESRQVSLEGLFHGIHGLTNSASVAGLLEFAQFAEAFEALLKELFEKPQHFTPSTLRTITLAVDFLGALSSQPESVQSHSSRPIRILVVDDEPLSRRAVLYGLEKARLAAVSFDNPQAAYGTLASDSFDLVFLDVDMPGMTGFELCTRLRALPKYKRTPVVFVTALTDFESRAQSTISGGNDLIAKPFLFVELAVKALLHVLRSRLLAAGRATA